MNEEEIQNLKEEIEILKEEIVDLKEDLKWERQLVNKLRDKGYEIYRLI